MDVSDNVILDENNISDDVSVSNNDLGGDDIYSPSGTETFTTSVDYSSYLENIAAELETLTGYCNLFFGVFSLALLGYYARKLVNRFRTRGKGVLDD